MSPSGDANERLDIELIAIKAGLKPANRTTVSADRAEAVIARARREGLFVECGNSLIEFPGRPASMVLYLCPTAAGARELQQAEAPLLTPAAASLRADEAIPLHVRVGQLLGFPACCVEEFAARLHRGITRRLDGRAAHEDFVAAEAAKNAAVRYLGRLNDLAIDRRMRIVTFYPCRYDCDVAAEYALGVFHAAEQSSPQAAMALGAALLGQFSISSNGDRGPAGRLPGEALTLDFDQF